MYDFHMDAEAKSRKLADRIKKLQKEKADLDQNLEAEKQRFDLARKAGLLVVSEFQGRPFEYKALEALFDKHFIDDYDRAFFNLKPLPANDSRKPKRRGRKKKEAAED
ncbi:MAG: hypothetical protein LBP33_03265 [Candidatus Adiutrix sp.]|jgi:hypothetical protein|nr:hypothetical protein [Candidatus Adiutrix sp.]